jgi:surfeit locus 1 family protein
MFARWRAAGLLLPTIMTLVMLPVLISLGTWQLHRKAWKEDLIARLQAGRTAEPISYTAALNEFVKTGNVEYRRVRVTGTFDHAQERHLFVPRAEGPSWHIYTLFMPEGGQPPLFINRGFVPVALKEAATRAAGQIEGPITITGLVRLPEATGWFIPAPDAKSNRWYARDLEAMRWAPEAPPGPGELAAVRFKAYAPFSIDAEAEPANPGGWPKGGATEINLPNRHLEYVVTWYGFAATLVVIFAVYARQRLQGLDRAA